MSDFDAVSATVREAHGQFAALVESIRPELHRYCARMTGSALDGEDLVQETLAQAWYRLALLRERVSLRPWLFTIAHHRCVDFLRSRAGSPMVDADEGSESAVEIADEIEDRQIASQLFSRFVLALPPRERAAVVLKEVLGYSLPEIAGILETSVGGVKSALHRGREKLAAMRDAPPRLEEPVPAALSAYVHAFNQRDWERLHALLEQEVQCELVGFAHLGGRDAVENSYLTNYTRLSYTWQFAIGHVDGERAIVCLRKQDSAWVPRHAIRLTWRADCVARIRDYAHVPYLLAGAQVDVEARDGAQVP